MQTLVDLFELESSASARSLDSRATLPDLDEVAWEETFDAKIAPSVPSARGARFWASEE